MTTLSAACLPPRQPPIATKDRAHPLFPIYQQYRASMSVLLVEADNFRDWLSHYERELRDRQYDQHPRMTEFREWMTANQGGARRCPAGIFPHNFNYWLQGGRW